MAATNNAKRIFHLRRTPRSRKTTKCGVIVDPFERWTIRLSEDDANALAANRLMYQLDNVVLCCDCFPDRHEQ